MKWHAQVLHVARKDLRFARWIALAYAALVAGATALSTGMWSPARVSPVAWTLSLILLGMILLALLVQADSPSRSNVLWATLPLRRSAVLSAKLLVAVTFLLGLPLLGQLAGIYAHSAAPGSIPALLAASALTYGTWLGIAAVAAAVTPDLRTFLVSVVLMVIGGVLAQGFLLSRDPSADPSSPALLAGITGAALLILAHQYLTRDARRGVWLAAGAGVVVLLLPTAFPSPAESAPAAPGTLPAPLLPASVVLEDVRLQDGLIQLPLRVEGGSRAHQYLLVDPSVRIRMPDGKSEMLRPIPTRISLNVPGTPLDGMRPLGRVPPARDLTTLLPLTLSAAQWDALAHGGARLWLRGYVEVREPRASVELPLVPGATAAREGERTRIGRVEVLPSGPFLEVTNSSLSVSSAARASAFMIASQRPEYFLVNRERGELLPLMEGKVSSTGLALVLPGPGAELTTSALTPSSGAAVPGPDWVAHARLQRVRWTRIGSFPLSIETRGTRGAKAAPGR